MRDDNKLNLIPEAPEALQLTTKNDDLKELIDYLEWSDMMNIADSSKTIYTAACKAFKKKYGHLKIDCIDNVSYSRTFAIVK